LFSYPKRLLANRPEKEMMIKKFLSKGGKLTSFRISPDGPKTVHLEELAHLLIHLNIK